MGKPFKILTCYFVATLLVASCEMPATAKIEKQPQVELVIKPLGSKYFITIPSNYQISEYHGPDYVDFGILPVDSTTKNFCEAGIIFGNSIGAIGPLIYEKNKHDTIKSKILGKSITWTIYDLDSSFFAESIVKEEFCASILSKNRKRNEIIDFLKVFESLKEK